MAELDLVLRRLAEFVSFKSVSGEEGPLAERIAEICRAEKVEAVVEGRNVVARRGGGGLRLLLNSHLDTIPPVSGWSVDPFTPRIEGGRLRGLGSNDAKASVAAMLEAFLTAPLPEEGTLIFAGTCDEETGGEGFEKLAPGLPFDAAIIGEPNDFRVAVAQKGLIKLRLVATGKAGHAARPELAENAIAKAAKDVQAIEGLRFDVVDPYLGRPSVTTTMISGGTKSNVVPDRCEVTIDGRSIPGFDNDALIRAVRAVVSSTVEVRSSRLKPVSGDSGSKIAKAALAAMPGREATGFPSVSDLAHVGGRPAIVFGPGTPDQSHTADESVSLEAVAAAPEIYRRTIREYFR
jgi:acetylornithine deacetylase